MLKTRRKRLLYRNEAAVERLASIEASIRTLKDEDLLDFADIFKADLSKLLADMAFAEMARRGIKL